MKGSVTILNLSKALLTAQKAMGGATKGAKNPFYQSKYADYGSVLEVVKEPLNNVGVVVLQPTIFRDGKTLVETTLIHAESGEFISGEIEVVCSKQNDPQSYGSALTYARRYSLQAMLSIPSEDDDGEKAMNRTSTTKATQTVPLSTGSGHPVSTATVTSINSKTAVAATPPVTNAPVTRVTRPTFNKAKAQAEAVAVKVPAAEVEELVDV